MNKCLFAAAALLLAASAHSQTVWRCGTDRSSYSDQPCPQGQVVAVADFRSAEQVQAAREVVSRDVALARELQKRRDEIEAQAALAVRVSTRPAVRAEIKPKKTPPAARGIWRAVAPASRRIPG